MKRKLTDFIDGNSYYNRQLGFYIEKPDTWSFLPKEWTIQMRETTLENNPELKDKLKDAAIPFLSFHLFHNDINFAYPSVNCSCRLINSTPIFDPKSFLNLILRHFNSMFDGFEVLEAYDDFIISGYKGIFIRSTHYVYNSEGEPIKCLNRTIIINKPLNNYSIMYNIGLNGNYDGEYCCEEAFNKIIKSIAIE